MTMHPPSRPVILLVDNHPVVREALAKLLDGEGLGVSAQANGRKEALAQIASNRPDVALVDLSLDDGDGLDLVTDLHELGIPVLVCSTHEEPEYVKRALAAGARGYITKREANRDLARAVRDVLKGWLLISPRAADEFPDAF